ncbi:MAG TPA: DNA polymerase III subunit delta' [Salinimicrobium sp.]|nr:DNA polymerase III subunit delta' [Salinimicrobium sp.]
MLFSEVFGLAHIKKHLTTTAQNGRIPHAQLFIGPAGSEILPMAIAYAQYVLCQNSGQENTSGNSSCNLRMNQLTHPDLHFAFPVATNDKIKSHPVSANFLDEWRKFILKNPYGSLFDWYQELGIENKQGMIGVDEAQDIVKSLSLKSYEGGYKVMIIWMAEKMNPACSNKLLKLIEEPPNNTLFILITEEEGNILSTIRSRCQSLHFPPLNEAVIAEGLVQKSLCNEQQAHVIARRANGSFHSALKLLETQEGAEQFEEWFIKWVRNAFKAKGNKNSIFELLAWSEMIAATGRETQKKFLLYCIDFFRQAMLLNYKAKDLVYIQPETNGFSLEKFAAFVHGNNILNINNELQDAIYHIERNGNAKLILTDLSIKLTRYLHQPA